MNLLLIVFCGFCGSWAMPHHEPGHGNSYNDYDKETFTGFVPLIRGFPGLLFNSEASPALPTGGTADATRIKTSSLPLLVSNNPFDGTTTEINNDVLPPTTTTTTTPTTTTTSTSTTTTPRPNHREENDYGGSTTAASSQTTFLLPTRGADPSIQLQAPSYFPSSPTTISPRNIHDIPLSLVSLSGNSGGITSSEEDVTSPQIPEQMGVDFTKFRYHVETGKLVKIGSTGEGICPKNMRFFAVPAHPKNGQCDCDYYQCSRPLIYSPEKHQCFWAWSQGPCQNGEWFIFNKDLRKRGICAKNPCPPDSKQDIIMPNATESVSISSSDYFFLNPEDDTCYQAATQGYCSDSDERLLIFPGEPIPKCRNFTLCYPLTVPQEVQCIFGSKYYVESGQC